MVTQVRLTSEEESEAREAACVREVAIGSSYGQSACKVDSPIERRREKKKKWLGV